MSLQMMKQFVRIKPEDYEWISKLPENKWSSAVEDIMPDYITWGYGYYGLVELVGGESPYAIVKTGESCD